MLSVTDFNKTDKVLDLGCGYGAVGILAAKLVGPENVVMTDIDQTAVELAIKNAQINHTEGIKILQSDGFAKIDDKDFTVILVNPPYHTDFSVAKRFIEKGFNRLCIGGRMMIVTKRMNWYKNKLTSIFGGTGLYEIDGYFVFAAVKRNKSYANAGK
jgi:16S rRNA (guanine1207-N2)-methyltransferase